MTHIPIILEQHAEDAAILWVRRDRAVNAANFDRVFLGRLDEQLEAHVDGLRVAGDPGWDEAVRMFDSTGEAGEMFAMALLAFSHADTSRIPEVLERAVSDPANLVRPVVSAIGWLPKSALHGKVTPLIKSDDPLARFIGIGACSVHRVDPGTRLDGLLNDNDPDVRDRAARLAGELGRVDLRDPIVALCGTSPLWAPWAATLLGDRKVALRHLMSLAENEDSGTQLALLACLPALGLDAGRAWLDGLPITPGCLISKVRGYGILGDAGAIPWLIDQMNETALGQAAGESYSMITGTDLEFEDLDAAPPPDAPEAPNDDPADINVTLPLEEDTPWPTAELVANHWGKIGRKFGGDGQFHLGKPAGNPAFQSGFSEGNQRQRRVASYWLASQTPDAALPNWKVPVRGLWG